MSGRAGVRGVRGRFGRRKSGSLRGALLAVGLLFAAVGCGPPAQVPPPSPPAVDAATAAWEASLGETLPLEQTRDWIDVHLPQLAYQGYTLDLYKRRIPILVDMNGAVVHSWDRARAIGRARLAEDGSLYLIGSDNRIQEWSWDGDLVWSYALGSGDELPHHDLIRLSDGRYVVLAHSEAARTDLVLAIDRARGEVWRWVARDHLDEAFPKWDRQAHDPTHLNSIQELPPNRLYDHGDDRFRPGNLLISARNLNAIFVLDPDTGAVRWVFDQGLGAQHEALMVPPGLPGAGLITVFNNHWRLDDTTRSSRVEAIEPSTGERAWTYQGRYLFSSIAGAEQVLPNGNLLITSSQGGRVLEIRPAGQVVWQWAPPYLPMRALRYAPDHCPQLAALPREPAVRVAPDSRRLFVSRELGKLALQDDYETREVAGARRQVLKEPSFCGELMLPPMASAYLEYGLDPSRVQGAGTVRFRTTVRGPDDPAPVVVLDDTVRTDDGELWRGAAVALQHYPYMQVRMCVAAEVVEGDEAALAAAVWQDPQAVSTYRPLGVPEPSSAAAEQVPNELEEQRLRAIGYLE